MISVKIAAHVVVTEGHADAAVIVPACLDPNDLTASQEVGEFLQRRSIQAVVFPSAIPGFSGRNLVVFRDVIPPPVILLANREQILDELRRLADRMRR